MRIISVTAVFLVAFSGAATAAKLMPAGDTSINHTLSSDASVSTGDQAIAPLPLEIKTEGDITYVTGGVGDEELAMLKDKGGDFNLHLLLNAKNGEYVSSVDVKIVDAKGTEVLSVDGAGPYLYAKLPAGKYSLEASRHEQTKKLSFTIGKGLVDRNIRFED